MCFQAAHAADTYTPTYYYYYPGSGYAPAIGPKGSLAQAPLELIAAAPAVTEGEMTLGDVIGRQGLRAAEARVLLVAVTGRRRLIPAGTALAKVLTNGGNGPTVWCDIRAWTGQGRRGEHDCLADSRASGAFDQLWLGESPGYFLGPGVNVVRSPGTLSGPAVYRPARPEERPTGLIGYRWCSGDGSASPARFAPAVTATGDSVWTIDTARGCALGLWPDPSDRSRLELDGKILHVELGGASGALRYRFIDPKAPAGPMARSVVAKAQEPGDKAPLSPAAAPGKESPARALVAAGPGPAAVGGNVVKGQSFFTVGVKHGITGVLKNEVQSHTWLSDRKLPFDQPLFGVPMAGSSGPGMVWCAPQAKPDGKTMHWVAACLVDSGSGYVWVDAHPAMMTVDLSWNAGGGRAATPPSVDRRAVDLPLMTLSYAFAGWNKEHWAKVDMQIDWGEGPQKLRTIAIPPGPDGAAALTLMGAEIRIRHAKSSGTTDQALVEVLSPPIPGGDITY